ncbi:gliding motility lipoprotein GldB [Winogradskyella ursingii]|uniref:gliding motility lipoprotein GldB n=1 Tax=Winogradskyella ursingii TaxID=2686079 RepID=UPI0015C6B157|nr:gliding motility lipoprotein GldB [Winogradskyella ursingii]
MRIYFILLFGLCLLSCDNDSKLAEEISAIDVDFNIERFDTAFMEANPEDLQDLKNQFPFLFSKRVPDSVVIAKMNDTLQVELLNEVKSKFTNLNETKDHLESLFQHLKYYEKTFEAPRVVTLTNDVDYRNSVIVNDSLVLIALDNYLGSEHKFYQSFPKYITENMTKQQIIADVAEGYANQYAYQTNRKTLLDEMVYFGKLLYFKDVMTPFLSDTEKIGYTKKQLEWAKANESSIWSYFIEKELLYSSDNKLSARFIANAPFSKFYLEKIDNESPGRLGQYLGWQIVRAYAINSGKDIMEIMQTEPEFLFNKSKYKPRK